MIPPLHEEPAETTSHVLPDVLEPNLTIVFCGTAAGATSARAGAYYAGPGNKFWKTLYTVRLTPQQLKPSDFRTLPQYGLGLTDLAKYASGSDQSLRRTDYAVKPFLKKIRGFAPKLLCFNSKKAAKTFLGTEYVEFGLNGHIGNTQLFVAPSTSGAASGHWDIDYWHQLVGLSQTL